LGIFIINPPKNCKRNDPQPSPRNRTSKLLEIASQDTRYRWRRPLSIGSSSGYWIHRISLEFGLSTGIQLWLIGIHLPCSSSDDPSTTSFRLKRIGPLPLVLGSHEFLGFSPSLTAHPPNLSL